MNPHSIAEEQYQMAQKYSELSAELGKIEMRRATAWLEARKQAKTDKEADRVVDSSPAGQRAVELKFTLKGMEKLMSSAKALLKTLSDEAHNQY